MDFAKMIRKFFEDTKAKVNVVGILVTLVLLSALLPTIRGFVTAVGTNGSAAEAALYGVLTIVIAVAVVYGVIKESGISKAN